MKTPTPIRFELAQRGAIHVNSATFLHLSDEAFVLSLDCAQKYPRAMSAAGDGGVEVILYCDDRTLHVPDDAPREGTGYPHWTILRVHGFDSERWHIAIKDGKWGPMVYGVRRVEPDRTWPAYFDERVYDDR